MMVDSTSRAVYLVVDVSGSTKHSGLNALLNEAMPEIVDAMCSAASGSYRLAIVSAGSQARHVLRLTNVEDIWLIPSLAPEGIGLLAPALLAVAASIAAETARAEVDAQAEAPTQTHVVTIGDGESVDVLAELVHAYQAVVHANARGMVRLATVVVGESIGVEVAGASGPVTAVAAAVDPAEFASRLLAAVEHAAS